VITTSCKFERDVIEYVVEYAERFPDMRNHQILDSVEEYTERQLTEVEENIVIAAYNYGIQGAAQAARAWGIEIQ